MPEQITSPAFLLQKGTPAIDLSMPIEPHWRFAPTIDYTEQQTAGCAFHSTRFTMGAHAFTHVDAPWHVDPDGIPLGPDHLEQLWGPAVIVDVSGLGADQPISEAALRAAAPEITPGDIVIIRSRHEDRHPTTSAEYWTRAPWMTAEAVRWLATAKIAAVGFDFPQDRGIRAPYDTDWQPAELDDDWPCHRLLLHNGIPQIEYLAGLGAISLDRCLFFAVPLRFAHSDGSPIRAFAFDVQPQAGR
ncbi:cyclase family protein [Microlunatus soli]|uniref:Putative cyclase n=1 Tax=Microlunatus soli TaxID=630515 RepID=A0A1H1VK58_9ACTN|nr:cyclase family protein [Microlunatus soli]SDS84900.1 Putative cyclase [Microlunatus soli]